MVVVPVVVSIALLTGDGDLKGASSSAAGDGHPLAQLLLALAIVVAACKVAGWLCGTSASPPLVGEIAAGIVLGPSVLGAVWPAGARALFTPELMLKLDSLAQIGVVLFVFLAGLEVNTKLMRGRGHLAMVVSYVSIALPFLLVSLAIVAYTRFGPKGIGFLAFASFLGVLLSVTALPVLVRILKDTGLFHTEVGVVALTCAVVDDVTARCLLALVAVALATASSLTGVLITIAATAAFVSLLVFVFRPLLNRFVARSSESMLRTLARLALVGVPLCAMLTEQVGVHAMFGAFVFGLVFPRDNAATTWLRENTGELVGTLLSPLFCAYSGLRTDIGTARGQRLVMAMVRGRTGGRRGRQAGGCRDLGSLYW
jgi:Kef-type K+ transport system membrane component KefB